MRMLGGEEDNQTKRLVTTTLNIYVFNGSAVSCVVVLTTRFKGIMQMSESPCLFKALNNNS